MLTTLATLAALALMQQTDTTVPVRAGARLEISNFGGEIAVKTWNRNGVRGMAEHSSRDRIRVDASDQVVRVNAEANTVNGDITYDGTIKDGGRYRVGTHDGDVRVSVTDKANVSVSVSTFNGDFSACFPVQLTGKTKHRFNFTLGSGSARLELE